MKSSNSRWAKLMGIGVFAAMLLSIGAGPAAAVTTCRPGYIQAAPGLCISQVAQSAGMFETALYVCRHYHGRVASYGDLYYLYRYRLWQCSSCAYLDYNPNGKWIGPELVGDDQALCGNANITGYEDLDINNFEGTCFKWDYRQYWCAHDLD